MDALNLQIMVNLSGGTGDGLQPDARRDRKRVRHTDRMVMFANIDYATRRPGFGARSRGAARSRHQGRRARDCEIFKDFGISR